MYISTLSLEIDCDKELPGLSFHFYFKHLQTIFQIFFLGGWWMTWIHRGPRGPVFWRPPNVGRRPTAPSAYKRRSGSHSLSVLNDLGRAALHDGHTTVGRTWGRPNNLGNLGNLGHGRHMKTCWRAGEKCGLSDYDGLPASFCCRFSQPSTISISYVFKPNSRQTEGLNNLVIN